MIFTRVGEDGRLLPALLQRGATPFSLPFTGQPLLSPVLPHPVSLDIARLDNPLIAVIYWLLDREQSHSHDDVGGFMVKVGQPRRPKHSSLLAFYTAGLVAESISIAGSMKMHQIYYSISTAF